MIRLPPRSAFWQGVKVQTLRHLREAKGLSRNALAKKLGVSPTFVAWVEGGLTPLPESRVEAWGVALGVDPGEVARWVGGEVKLVGLTPAQRQRVTDFVASLRAAGV